MANNPTPEYYNPIVIALTTALGAAEAYPALGLAHNDAAAIEARLIDLVGRDAGPNNNPPAVPGAKRLSDQARTNKTHKTAALRAKESQGRMLIQAALGLLRPIYGQKWNSQWVAVGFSNNSLAVPSHPLPLLRSIAGFFTQNPTLEAPAAQPTPLTAASFTTAASEISKAITESKQSNTDAGTAHDELEAAIARGRDCLSGLRNELKELLSDDDERWYAFGFDRPVDSTVPEVPQNLTVTVGASGMVFANWDDSRRAMEYRAQLLDANGKKLQEKLCKDSETTFSDVPPGAAVSVVISARHHAHESQPCAPVSVTIP